MPWAGAEHRVEAGPWEAKAARAWGWGVWEGKRRGSAVAWTPGNRPQGLGWASGEPEGGQPGGETGEPVSRGAVWLPVGSGPWAASRPQHQGWPPRPTPPEVKPSVHSPCGRWVGGTSRQGEPCLRRDGKPPSSGRPAGLHCLEQHPQGPAFENSLALCFTHKTSLWCLVSCYFELLL